MEHQQERFRGPNEISFVIQCLLKSAKGQTMFEANPSQDGLAATSRKSPPEIRDAESNTVSMSPLAPECLPHEGAWWEVFIGCPQFYVRLSLSFHNALSTGRLPDDGTLSTLFHRSCESSNASPRQPFNSSELQADVNPHLGKRF
jgi:hypothetical protein